MTIVMCDVFFFARLIVDQSHTRAAERCSAPGSTCEVRMPERVVCQSAPARAARLAWARRPRLPLDAALEAAEDSPQHDVRESGPHGGRVASLAWTLAMSQRRIHETLLSIGILGLLMIEGSSTRGASSPANPSSDVPLPLSATTAATYSSTIVGKCEQGGK